MVIINKTARTDLIAAELKSMHINKTVKKHVATSYCKADTNILDSQINHAVHLVCAQSYLI